MATYQDPGSPVGIGSTVTAPPPQMLNAGDAMQNLEAAYRSGLVGVQDILDLKVKPYQRKAAIAGAQDQTSQSLANMAVRPSATRAAISQNTLGADTSDANDSLVPANRELQAKTIQGHLEDTGVADIERNLRKSQLQAQIALLPIQTEIAKATTEQERAIVTARGQSTQNIIDAETAKFKTLAQEALNLANDPGKLKTYYESKLADAGRLRKTPGESTLPELAQQVSDLYNEGFQRALAMATLEKRDLPEVFTQKSQDEFLKHKEVQEYEASKSAASALQSIVETSKTDPHYGGQDDNALGENFVKVLNPGGVIRQGTVDMMEAAIPGATKWLDPKYRYEKMTKGTFVTPEQREAMVRLTQNQLKQHEEPVKAKALSLYEAGINRGMTPDQAQQAVPATFRPLLFQALRDNSEVKPGGTGAAPAKPSTPAGTTTAGPASARLYIRNVKGMPPEQVFGYPGPNGYLIKVTPPNTSQ